MKIQAKDAKKKANAELGRKAASKRDLFEKTVADIQSTCRAKGWRPSSSNLDLVGWRYASISVERSLPNTSHSSTTVTGVFDVTIDETIKVAVHGTSFYNHGLADLHNAIVTNLKRLHGVANQKPKDFKMTLKLFVSHSSKDVEIVTLLVDLLRSALKLSANDIRCTSVDGYRLPGGAETLEHLRREVHDAEAFIGVISAASLESMYVAFELGARWGANKHLLPVLAPGAAARILSGPLSGINALRCDESAQLHQLITDLANKLGVQAEPASVYQRQIETVLERAVEIKKLVQSEKASVTGADKALSSLELEILAAVSKRQRATSSDIASDVNLSEDAARFYLDEMARGNLINWFGSPIPSMPSEYMLAHEGRRHLVKKETSNTLTPSKPVFNGDTFFFDGQGPYCTACWENSQKQISLKEAPHYEQRLTGFSLKCPICKTGYVGVSS